MYYTTTLGQMKYRLWSDSVHSGNIATLSLNYAQSGEHGIESFPKVQSMLGGPLMNKTECNIIVPLHRNRDVTH